MGKVQNRPLSSLAAKRKHAHTGHTSTLPHLRATLPSPAHKRSLRECYDKNSSPGAMPGHKPTLPHHHISTRPCLSCRRMRSLREYYDENSSTSAVSAVRTPLLVIGTRQDPLISEFMMEVPIAAARTNPNVLTVITRYGGHVGWLSSMQEDAWYMRLWFEFADSVQRMRAEDGRAAAVGVAASDAVSESCVEVSVVAGSSSADLEAAVQLATRSVGGCGPGSEPEVEAASAQRVLQVVVA
eukprot:357182-Chlamydomonas_euryale.AAC.3